MNIVNVTITQQVASAPSTLQKTGAIVSQGGTTLAANASSFLTQATDLTAILAGAEAITTATWASSVVTVTTTTPHGIPNGTVVQGIVSGVTPAGYNGTFAITSTGASTFTYPLVLNPGSMTVAGSFTLADVSELFAQVQTWFAQGSGLGVYVLELGVGTTAAGVTALQAYLNAPTVPFYAYLIPVQWDVEATAPTMFKNFASPTSKVYFYVTTTMATYSNWLAIKSVLTLVQAPNAPITEFSMASVMWSACNENPSSSNLMTPMSYSFVYGVTPNLSLTNAQQVTLTTAGVNWIATGAQGQISLTLIQNGLYMDLHPFSYWYGVDWVNINITIALAAAVINGSNTPSNPLYYNQAGINTLQKVAQSTLNTAIAFGLILAPATANAVGFSTYIAQNPSAYAAGTYGGLSATIVPTRGFTSITINLNASNIPV
jgi:hypothetical protein